MPTFNEMKHRVKWLFPYLTETKRFYLNNITVVNFSRVECYIVEKILRIVTTRLLPKLVLTIQNIPNNNNNNNNNNNKQINKIKTTMRT